MEEKFGSLTWNGFRSYEREAPELYTTEVRLFSDEYVLAVEGAEVHLGPYELVPVDGLRQPNILHATMPFCALRVPQYASEKVEKGILRSADNSSTVQSEIAALISLKFGIRVQTGPVERYFNLTSTNPKGVASGHTEDQMPKIVRRTSGIISGASKQIQFSDLQSISVFAKLRASQSTALIKSALLYQRAYWLSEENPQISWLLFTSSLEAAANFFMNSVGDENDEFKEIKNICPELYGFLEKSTNENLLSGELLRNIMEEISSKSRVRRNLLKFCLRYKPLPPKGRPAYSLIDYDDNNYRKVIDQIYQLRSRALHDGKAFPSPICSPPQYDRKFGHSEEGAGGKAYPLERPDLKSLEERKITHWKEKHLPMHLHTYHYIVQQTLMNWWKDMENSNN